MKTQHPALAWLRVTNELYVKLWDAAAKLYTTHPRKHYTLKHVDHQAKLLLACNPQTSEVPALLLALRWATAVFIPGLEPRHQAAATCAAFKLAADKLGLQDDRVVIEAIEWIKFLQHKNPYKYDRHTDAHKLLLDVRLWYLALPYRKALRYARSQIQDGRTINMFVLPSNRSKVYMLDAFDNHRATTNVAAIRKHLWSTPS